MDDRNEMRGITLRSIAIGLSCAALICAVTFLNDRVLRQTFIIGNNLPVSVYGGLILFVVFINPLLRRFALNAKEIAVILALTLAACCIPSSGLMRTFTSSLIMPHRYQQTEPGWQKQDIVNLAPKKMLADPTAEGGRVLDGFVQGKPTGQKEFGLSDIPWSGWVRTLVFWIPLILTLWAGLICLSVMLHRQWSSHELLSYPIANFTNSMLPNPKSGEDSIFRQRGFWIAGSIVLIIYTINYLYTWWPDTLVRIPTQFDFMSMVNLFPTLKRGGGERLFFPTIYFIVVGIAFLVPNDVSLSFGIGPFLWALVVGTLALYGVNVNAAIEGKSWYLGLTPRSFVLFGANIGILITMLFTGRRYYLTLAQRTLGLPTQDEMDKTSIISSRIWLFCMFLFVVQLYLAGIPLILAIMQTAIILVFYIVMSRLIAETGLFYIQPYFFPCAVLWGMFGVGAITPKTLLIMQIVSMVLMIDPRESLMPFMTNSLRLLEQRKVQLGRPAMLCMVAVIIGLGVALPTTLYVQYSHGSQIWEGWAEDAVPKMPFENAVAVKQELTAKGMLEDVENSTGIERLSRIKPNTVCMWALLLGLSAVLIVASARLRFPWWPIHPLIFVTWATEPVMRICVSFLLGWIIKSLVMKYGGSRAFAKVKPVMIGLMAGEILAAVIPSIVGAIYFMITGDQPPRFAILPL